MAIPNRANEVKAIAARYPQSFGPPDNTVDARRRLLMPIIVRELNRLDGDQWRLLYRLDREDDDPTPGRLTSDVIVWAPTREHVDVLSGNGPMWHELGVWPDTRWSRLDTWQAWPSWDTQAPPPPAPPDVEPPDSFDMPARVKALEEKFAKLKAAL